VIWKDAVEQFANGLAVPFMVGPSREVGNATMNPLEASSPPQPAMFIRLRRTRARPPPPRLLQALWQIEVHRDFLSGQLHVQLGFHNSFWCPGTTVRHPVKSPIRITRMTLGSSRAIRRCAAGRQCESGGCNGSIREDCQLCRRNQKVHARRFPAPLVVSWLPSRRSAGDTTI